jgi:hypothetical protein
MQTKEINTVTEFLESLKIMAPQRHDKLSIHYLESDRTGYLGIVSFTDAMEKGLLTVTEVGDGDVPCLKFISSSQNNKILIPESTTIEGLKQSRFCRVSILLYPMEELVVPVNCIEIGRFGREDASRRTKYNLYSKLRAMNIKTTGDSLKRSEELRNDNSQAQTWSSIDKLREKKERLNKRNISSPTGYVGDIFQDEKDTIDKYLRAFVVPDTACGLVAMLDRQIITMECFGDTKLFKHNHEAILSGIALDLDQDEINQQTTMTPEALLRRLIGSAKEQHKAVGHGQDIRFETSKIVGAALVDDKELYHLEAFAL